MFFYVFKFSRLSFCFVFCFPPIIVHCIALGVLLSDILKLEVFPVFIMLFVIDFNLYFCYNHDVIKTFSSPGPVQTIYDSL